MGSPPLAFSVHNFISSVGADAGFAAIIGLAILILLYFAQARETASLREHSEEAAARIHQLEARLAQVLQGESVPRGTNEAAAEAPQAQAQPARGAAAARPAGALAGGAPAASVLPAAMGPSHP